MCGDFSSWSLSPYNYNNANVFIVNNNGNLNNNNVNNGGAVATKLPVKISLY